MLGSVRGAEPRAQRRSRCNHGAQTAERPVMTHNQMTYVSTDFMFTGFTFLKQFVASANVFVKVRHKSEK